MRMDLLGCCRLNAPNLFKVQISDILSSTNPCDTATVLEKTIANCCRRAGHSTIRYDDPEMTNTTLETVAIRIRYCCESKFDRFKVCVYSVRRAICNHLQFGCCGEHSISQKSYRITFTRRTPPSKANAERRRNCNNNGNKRKNVFNFTENFGTFVPLTN